MPSVGVAPGGPHGREQPVELTRYGVLSRQLALLVDKRVEFLSFLRFALLFVTLVEVDDAVEVDGLLDEVNGPEAARPLEQHVLEVVSNPSRFSRVVFAPSAHGNLRIEPGLFVVLRQINGKAIVENVDVDPMGSVLCGL